MKVVYGFLLALLLAAVGGAYWVATHYTVVAARYEEAFIVVSKERATECEAHGGCAVMSGPEIRAVLSAILQQMRPRDRSGDGT